VIAADDLAVCRQRLRHGSRSFALAARLLPRSVADAATCLYAFCRVADDLIDDTAVPADCAQAHAQLCRRLDGIYAGEPQDHAEDRAFAGLVGRYAIPRELPEALLEGFAWDARNRRYQTLAEVEEYAVRVAGSVGMMLCLVMGERRPQLLARACDLGIAMQLTNIARDLGSDARLGRLYVPEQWFVQQGISARAWLASPWHDGRIATIAAALLRRAQELYRQADAGVERLPAGCRIGIRAARAIYADIGREIGAGGYDALSRRAVVSGPRKLSLLGAALMPRRVDSALNACPVHPGAAYLLGCATACQESTADGRDSSPWVNVAELFLRLDERTRLMTGAACERAASRPPSRV